ncbi:unnamed protein product [Soboliphyme baturini]|uniref:KH_dom_type_1 domain-containing protein n=1 Tax=Soboliphyme baturini TaxID=241478 RepID=A0A183ICV4_9BILA|nr:unnamed protein product [Soboliphyme baturini]
MCRTRGVSGIVKQLAEIAYTYLAPAPESMEMRVPIDSNSVPMNNQVTMCPGLVTLRRRGSTDGSYGIAKVTHPMGRIIDVPYHRISLTVYLSHTTPVLSIKRECFSEVLATATLLITQTVSIRLEIGLNPAPRRRPLSCVRLVIIL